MRNGYENKWSYPQFIYVAACQVARQAIILANSDGGCAGTTREPIGWRVPALAQRDGHIERIGGRSSLTVAWATVRRR